MTLSFTSYFNIKLWALYSSWINQLRLGSNYFYLGWTVIRGRFSLRSFSNRQASSRWFLCNHDIALTCSEHMNPCKTNVGPKVINTQYHLLVLIHICLLANNEACLSAKSTFPDSFCPAVRNATAEFVSRSKFTYFEPFPRYSSKYESGISWHLKSRL